MIALRNDIFIFKSHPVKMEEGIHRMHVVGSSVADVHMLNVSLQHKN